MFTDPKLPCGTEQPWAVTSSDCIDRAFTTAPAALVSSPDTGSLTGHMDREASPAVGDSRKITAWIADGGLGAGRLRTVNEVQEAATRVLEMSGASDVLGVTAFTVEDGRVYAVRVVVVVQEAEPAFAHKLIVDALENCPEEDEARQAVLSSHLRRLVSRTAFWPVE